MPVFINEVVVRSNIDRPGATAAIQPAAAAGTATDRDALVAEVTQAVLDHLERELDRIGER